MSGSKSATRRSYVDADPIATLKAWPYDCLRSALSGPPPSYCTFAVTDAVPFSVNVQLFDLLFEHAPENTASRPLPTVNVIDVPTVNDAVFVDPLITSSPVGVDVTCTPLRPVTVR